MAESAFAAEIPGKYLFCRDGAARPRSLREAPESGTITPMFEAFINPWMLAGAAGAAVPVVIHLLVRRRFKRVPWAAMELLLRAFKKTRRRLRMENLLILLLRMAVIILAAIAVARPVIRTSTVVGRIGDSNRAVFLVVDNS